MADQEKAPDGYPPSRAAEDDSRPAAGDARPRARQANRSTTETQGARVGSRAESGGGVQTPSRQQK
jgi:hypothetical protein